MAQVSTTISMTGRDYFLGALYHTTGRFSHLPRFLRSIPAELSSQPYDHGAVLTQVQEARSILRAHPGRVTSEQARNLLIAQDLDAVELVLSKVTIRRMIDERADMGAALHRCKARVIGLLEERGIRVGSVEVMIVDDFPFPYAERPGSALTLDRGDTRIHKVDPGIYFRRSGLRPFYSEFLLCHEIIHAVLGERDPALLARGLEEGLAEVLGGVHLATEVLGEDLTEHLFVYNRLSDAYDPFWEQYIDAARGVACLYHRGGLGALYHLLCGGRRRVKAVEKDLFTGNLDAISIGDASTLEGSNGQDGGHGEPRDRLSTLVDFLCLTYPRAFIVSPMARYMCQFVKAGYTTSEILTAARADRQEGQEALKELDRIGLLTFRSDGAVVTWSDCERYADTAALRYRV